MCGQIILIIRNIYFNFTRTNIAVRLKRQTQGLFPPKIGNFSFQPSKLYVALCIKPKTCDDLTALTDLVDYQSNFKLHKQRSLLLQKSLAFIMEINGRQLFSVSFLIKKVEKCGAHVKGWETCLLNFLFLLVAQHASQQTAISYVYLFRHS